MAEVTIDAHLVLETHPQYTMLHRNTLMRIVGGGRRSPPEPDLPAYTAPPSYTTDAWVQQGEDDRVTIVGESSSRPETPTMEDSPPPVDQSLHGEPSSTELGDADRSAETLPSEEVVLSWEPDVDPDAASTSSISLPGHDSTSSVHRPRAPGTPADEPFGAPPGYSTSRTPTATLVYTFSPHSFNSMLLLPPPDAADTRPQYHIAIHLNCFIPSSFITIVRRGATENGQHVGEFECAQRPS